MLSLNPLENMKPLSPLDNHNMCEKPHDMTVALKKIHRYFKHIMLLALRVFIPSKYLPR